ncbi:MAG: substrate-binding domain-containing protein, partial [Steroidobacter sp.]
GNITNQVVIAGQAFAIYVNKSVTGNTAGLHINISKQSLTSIFSGLYTDWSQVPKADGSGFLAAGAINVCLRDAGSGTQAGDSIFFNGQNCSTAPYGFTSSPYARNNSTGNDTSDELGCVAGHSGAIGFATVQAAIPANSSIVDIDGVVASRTNAANGSYGYWYEATFNYNSTLTGSANENALAQTLITRLQTAATVPASSANTFALPIGSNSIVLPVDASHPVALGTRSGNSCALPLGQN